MKPPDQRLFEEDLLSAEFQIGCSKGWWGLPSSDMAQDVVWPKVVIWIAAPVQNDSPDRFYICLDATGYRTDPPTGTFWDPATESTLDVAKRPKGRENSRLARVFRTDWKDGLAFYHPYDRAAATEHPNWKTEQPHLIWDCEHTIVDYLEQFYSLLQSGDYIGV